MQLIYIKGQTDFLGIRLGEKKLRYKLRRKKVWESIYIRSQKSILEKANKHTHTNGEAFPTVYFYF